MTIHTKHGDNVIYVANARYGRKRFTRYNRRLDLPNWMVQAERFIRTVNQATWPSMQPFNSEINSESKRK